MTNQAITISSKENPKFKHVRALLETARYRKKNLQTVLEGTHLIQSYLEKGGKPKQLWVAENAENNAEVTEIISMLNLKTTLFSVNNQLYKQLRSIGEGINLLAVIDYDVQEPTTINTDALILNDVQDAGNVGTLLRTAAAVGITQVVCTKGTANVWSPKCLRASMGAHFALNIYENIEVQALESLIEVPLMATSSHTNNIIYKQNLKQPLAWVMGNEGNGVCESLMNASVPIALPQKGEESLNVAVAGALCMYEMLRQRQFNNC